MQIHELATRTPNTDDYVALDTGSQTYKGKAGDLKPAFTTGDATNPTQWSDVPAVTSGSSFSNLFNRISTMMKNVRYIWKLIGSETMGTVATTLTGAIAEHEEDISTIDGNLSATSFNLTTDSTNVTSGSGKGVYDKASKTVRIYLQWNNTTNVSSSATLFTIPSAYRPSATVTGYGIVRTSGDVPLPAAYSVSTSGAVAQTASNAARGGFSMIEYILG